MTLRQANLEALPRCTFDVLVVGSGINGAVAAAALSAHGARVALVDRGDFGGLTSQASSNLIWGGIKYLESFEVPLVWDLCGSRNRLLRAYPSSVREARFYTCLEKGFRYRPWMMLLGTWVYWLFGRGFTKPPRLLTRARIGREEPAVDASRFVGGVEYSDAYLLDNDSRFVFGFVRTALNANAVAANYVELLEAKRAGNGPWVARLRDRETGAELEARATVLINAAGPYVDAVNERLGISTTHRHVFSKGVHLVVDRVSHSDRVLTFFDDAGRLFFVIPMGPCSVIGTTDTPVQRPETHVTAEDRRFLLDNVNHRLSLSRPLSEQDIIAERCGVRPLVVDAGAAPAAEQAWLHLSRKHVLEAGDRSLCMYGGKLTDCVNVGAETVALVTRMGIELTPTGGPWYGEPPVQARDELFRRARLMRIDELGAIDPAGSGSAAEPLSRRLWRRYGLRSFAMLEDMRLQPEMARVLIEGAHYRRCELHSVARSEMVTRLEDFVRRRSKISLVIPREQLRQASGLREACHILFGADAERRYDEYFDSPADQIRNAC